MNYPGGPVAPPPLTTTSSARAHVTVDVNNSLPLPPPPPSSSLDTSYSTQGTNNYDSRSSLISSAPNTAPMLTVVSPPTAAAATAAQVPPLAAGGGGGDVKRNAQQQGHPLKSFTVPAPPPPLCSAVLPMKVVSPLNNHRQSTGNNVLSSPYKKNVHAVGPVSPPALHHKGPRDAASDVKQQLQPSYSTEELNQEMANLEGLMKDLNAITASEFSC